MLSKEISEYPYESERRIIIIDRAETLTREAANALLKTLEEPPPYNHFFLITSVEKEVPPTIRSRCTRIFFTALSKEQLKQFFSQDRYRWRTSDCSPTFLTAVGCGLFWAEEENFLLRRMIVELIMGRQKSLRKLFYCRKDRKNR
jgi:hypothetical protein